VESAGVLWGHTKHPALVVWVYLIIFGQSKENPMLIDWSRVMESLLLMAPTAAISGYIGARVKSHLDKAQPHITITMCRKGAASDLIERKITLPDALVNKLHSSPWCEKLGGKVNVAKIFQQHERLQNNSSEAKSAIGMIEDKLKQLASLENADAKSKRAFLDEITTQEMRIIDCSYTGALCRQEYALPTVSDDELKKNPKIAEYTPDDGDRKGFKINLQTKFYNLNHPSKLDNFLEPLAKAICYFHIPSLEMLLSNVREDLALLVTDGSGLMVELQNLLSEATPLIVEVSIVNRGRSTVTFSSWGVCRLLYNGDFPPLDIPLVRASSYWKPEDPVLAFQQQKILIESNDIIPLDRSNFFSVEAGRGGEMKYRSVDSLDVLEKKFPHLTTLLSTDVFRCQVMLKRADVSTQKKAWIPSQIGRFGSSNNTFPQADLPVLCRRWRK
jgi:hypothetical protein